MEMMMSLSTSEALVATVIVLSTIYFIRNYLESRRYPSGPTSLPVVGNLHQIMLAGGPIEFYDKYHKKYGNVYTITISAERKVVISGYENIHLLLNKHGSITSGRNLNVFPTPVCNILKQRPGLIYSQAWKERREQCTKYLRQKGMGKSVLEPLIFEEIKEFCGAFIERPTGEGLDLQQCLMLASCNIIYTMMMGARLDYTDPKLTELVTVVHDLFNNLTIAIMTKQISFFAWLPGDPLMQKRTTACYKKYLQIMDEIIAARKEAINSGQSPSLLADHLLVGLSDSSCGADEKIEKDAGTTLEQVLSAGTDTSATALSWTFLYMTVYRHVQERVHQELDSVLESGEPLTYAMKSKLPYTEAVILESLRCSVMISVTLPHLLEESVSVEGKVIPANTGLVFNLQSVYKDPSVFEKPEVFNPERFLVGDIKLKRSYIGMTFGSGRRACLGEPLARMETFLFFASIMHRYRVEYKGSEPPSLKGVRGLTNAPYPYRVEFTKRF